MPTIAVESPLGQFAFRPLDFPSDFGIRSSDFPPDFPFAICSAIHYFTYGLIFTAGRHAFHIRSRKGIALRCTSERDPSDALDHRDDFLWLIGLAHVGVQQLSFTPGVSDIFHINIFLLHHYWSDAHC